MLTNGMTPETIPWEDGNEDSPRFAGARRLKSSSKPRTPRRIGVLHEPQGQDLSVQRQAPNPEPAATARQVLRS